MKRQQFIIQRYPISSVKIPSSFDGVKIAVLADLHNQEYGEKNEQLIRAIVRERPEMILVAGDMVLGNPKLGTEIAERFFKGLSHHYSDRIYYGMGNHEHRMKLYPELYGECFYRYRDALERMGVHVLENEKLVYTIEKSSITCYFSEIDRLYYNRTHNAHMEVSYLNSILGKPNPKEYNVLIAHTPFYFKAYAAWGADLVLSGHNHGGIVRIPFLGGIISPNMRIFPKYDAGRFREGESTLILSAGLGSHTIPIRINNPPELVILELHRKTEREEEGNGNTRETSGL